ncbi:MAG: hypothetical protein U0168_25435 [Nannocystaceae bacterium]
MGAIHRQLGAFEPAIVDDLRALAIREAAFGPDDAKVAETLVALSRDQRGARAWADATATAERLLALRARVHGPDAVVVGEVESVLARIAIEQAQGELAIAHAQRALTIYDAKAPGSADAAECRLTLARALELAAQDPARARALALEARATLAALDADEASQLRTAVDAWLREHPAPR